MDQTWPTRSGGPLSLPLVLVGGLDLRLMKMRLYRSWEVSLVERPPQARTAAAQPINAAAGFGVDLASHGYRRRAANGIVDPKQTLVGALTAVSAILSLHRSPRAIEDRPFREVDPESNEPTFARNCLNQRSPQDDLWARQTS
jgi:hypothetical protein